MADREQSAEEIFAAALDLPPGERSAFLAKACQESPELRTLVNGLFKDFQQMGTFLDTPAVAPAPPDIFPRGGSFIPSDGRFGRYTIMEPLGSGGMSTVYRAMDEKLERAVALKILTPGVLSGPDARRRFRKEALALAKLSHSAIAPVYDVGEQDGVDYLVMECIPGGTLGAKLKAGPLEVKEATSILLQIAQALEEAHERGIVHRDLKPANVMITPKGQVKVLDFGIAKLLAPDPADMTQTQTGVLIGTPLYMSPEQAQGHAVDARTDLWSLGVMYFECLTGKPPFRGPSNLAVLHAIIGKAPETLAGVRPEVPAAAGAIVVRALEKNPEQRYQTAAEMAADAANLLATLTSSGMVAVVPDRRRWRPMALAAAVALLLAIAAGWWFYERWSGRQWARNEAIPQIQNELEQKKSLAAFLLLEKAEKYLPGDAQLKAVADQNTRLISLTSSPSGATVEIQDYSGSHTAWHRLGVSPLNNVRIPKGYLLWKVSKAGVAETVTAPETRATMNFPLDNAQRAPTNMVWVPGGAWRESIDFIGWVGPYQLPGYYVDKFEVTNRDYQKFVDNGGYAKQEYWHEKMTQDGHDLAWSDEVVKFVDTTGRPGPSTWVAGHYPEGQADYPVVGVSWFEASAYAAYVGKQLPVLAQFFKAAPTDTAYYTVPLSNMLTKSLAPVGTYKGIGPYGTYDMAGNAREWIANPVGGDRRFILGGSWTSPSYLYFDPEAISPFDRSDTNGFRCVRNQGDVPLEAQGQIQRNVRDFAHFTPASDSVFRAYGALYSYRKTPLNAVSEGVVSETADWREEKVSFDTAYLGERMSAYLFLPKNVKPPYQTVLFFPSARIMFIPDNKNGTALGDLNFFNYIVQSGRAVMYPIYENTYERQEKFRLPGGSQAIEMTTDWYKDAGRSLDYLATRQDIDNSRLAYLGVSMGAAEGVIAGTLLQDRLKTMILLDGGYFLDPAPPGGDAADFAPRMKKPVLMVNGRYDFTFSLDMSQKPLFAMLGTPEAEKKHVLLNTPHDVTEERPQLVKAVLDWLDLYLGRVR